MNYILNSLEEIQKVYTPSIEELQDSFLPCLSEFKLSKKVILESMRFRIKLSDGKEEEGFSSELSLEAILTGIKFNLISKSSVIHNFDYNYLLNNIDFIVFKEELEKSLADLKKRFYNDIEECRKIPNFEISLYEFLNKLYTSKSFLESLDSEDNIIMIITDCYLKSYRNLIGELKTKYEGLFPKCFPKQKTLIDWNVAPFDETKIYRDLFRPKNYDIYDPNKVVKPFAFNNINKKTQNKSDFDKIWFKVGVLFAEGKIQKLKEEQPGIAFNKIAEYFGNLSYETYLKATVNDYRKTNVDKNIYSSLDKMNCIVDYCKMKKINLNPEFLDKYEVLLKQY